MTENRDATGHIPNKCYYKPNRKKPRYYTEADVARIFCQAKADSGATETGFIRRCKCWEGKTSECEELRQYLLDALAVLAEILLALAIPQSAIARALIRIARVAQKILPPRWARDLEILLERIPSVQDELRILIERGKTLVGPP